MATVARIVDSYIGVAAYADLEALSRLAGEALVVTGAQLQVNSDPRLRRALNDELKRRPGVQTVVARADIVASVEDTVLKNQRVFIGLLVLFAGCIFFGSVLNASLVGLAERRREVATLRVLGYTEWQVGSLFLRESAIANLVGTLLGLPLGYALNVAIVVAYDTEMFRIPVIDPTEVMLFTVAVGLAFGLAAQAVVQASIFRLDWLDALKVQE
jgi:putative ABC transport system permease protein